MRRLNGPRDTGAVATEFALLMAFMPLPFLAFGIIDYGEVMAQATNLTATVRGAAEYARGQVVAYNGDLNKLPTAADLQNLLGVSAAVFTTSSFCTCADNTPTICQPNSCTSKKPDTRVLTYIAVSGSQTFTPLISATWSFPATVNARTVLRTQ